MDEAAVFADFGVDLLPCFGVKAELGGGVVTVDEGGVVDKFGEGGVKVAEHADTVKFFVGDKVELFLDVGGETIVDDMIEVVGEEVGN